MNENDKEIQSLPSSNEDYWGDAEKHILKPESIDICETHTPDNWTDHRGYKNNHDGTVSCVYCPWGTRIPGYMRVFEGRIVDLRNPKNRSGRGGS